MGVCYFRYSEVSDDILKSIWGMNSEHREMSSTSSYSTGNLTGDEMYQKGLKGSEVKWKFMWGGCSTDL
jgi:hypothetical protein